MKPPPSAPASSSGFPAGPDSPPLPAILVCDDDPDILATWRRTLRGYDVVETGSPRAAMDAMKGRQFDAVVSDYQLDADLDGLDLLQHVRMTAPETIRFLVTASRTLDVAVRAVNEGAVDRFFLKPWSDDKLRAALEILLRSRRR